jgi:hypothetical protein
LNNNIWDRATFKRIFMPVEKFFNGKFGVCTLQLPTVWGFNEGIWVEVDPYLFQPGEKQKSPQNIVLRPVLKVLLIRNLVFCAWVPIKTKDGQRLNLFN